MQIGLIEIAELLIFFVCKYQRGRREGGGTLFSLKGRFDVECNTNFKFFNGEKQITAGQRKIPLKI
jgi:hypothetical protein